MSLTLNIQIFFYIVLVIFLSHFPSKFAQENLMLNFLEDQINVQTLDLIW